MKKQILFAAAFLISTLSFAQLKSPEGRTTQVRSNVSKATFGVRAGILSSGIRGEASNNFDDLLNFADGRITTNNRLGFYAGGYAAIPVSKGILFEPGIFYSQKGYEMTGSIESKNGGFFSANGKARLQSEYIDIPLLLKADLGGGLQIFAGPQFSYLAKANLNTTAGMLGFDLYNNDRDVTKHFNQWDAAVTGGIGFKFSNGINLNASYDYGLSRIDKNQNSKAYHHAFKAGLGIEF